MGCKISRATESALADRHIPYKGLVGLFPDNR